MQTSATPGTRPADEDIRASVQRRTLTVVVVSQLLGGAGLAAGVSVGALLALQMLGGTGFAGLPIAVFTLGSALSAFLIGRVTQRYGRRPGLAGGFTAGGAGALGVVLAAHLDSVPLLFVALFVYGSGTATNLQARYAGTDLAPPHRRGAAISAAMVSTTVGAVAGPNLVTPMGHLATGWGLPALAGPFLLAAVAYLAAGLTLAIFLRPDPFFLARRLPPPGTGSAAPERTGNLRSGIRAGAAVMLVTQVAMVAIMTMTPVHLHAHHHGLDVIGLVIGLHIAAMYLPSLATGMLVDRFGRTTMAVASGVTLLLAGVAAATLGESVAGSSVALILLGLGWNFGLITGTTLVVDSTTPADRPRVQGGVDVLIAVAGAGGGALSGVLMSATGYAALSVSGSALALLLLPVLLRRR